MEQIYVFKVGSTFLKTQKTHGDFDAWILASFDSKTQCVTVVDVEDGDVLPAPQLCSKVIISGSHNMVSDNLPWNLDLEKWIQNAAAVGVSILGICFGHQLIARALGGSVVNHSKGIEVGTVPIEMSETAIGDELFGALPQDFSAHASHTQTISRLPEGAVVLASNAFEKNHIVRYAPSIWGVQFHPEFTEDVMIEYIVRQRKNLVNDWFDIGKLIDEVTETSVAAGVIAAFAGMVQENRMAG
ncbi:MAG: glutamine amidotransferase [Reichenbachiella sp.]